MTTDDPTKVTAIIESTATRKPEGQATRLRVQLSFPLRSHSDLALMLMDQIGNPLEITISRPLQVRLPDPPASATITGPAQDIRYAPHRTTVDGVEAEVLLPVTEGGPRNSIKPHPFKEDSENKGKCLWCKRAENYTAHDASRIDAAVLQEIAKVKSNGHRANPTALAEQGAERAAAMQAAGQTPHAFLVRGGDNQCGACGQGVEAAVHVWQLHAYEPDHEDAALAVCMACGCEADADIHHGADVGVSEGNEMPAVAQDLIDEARKTPATEAEAQQQAEAEAALAGRSKA